MEVLSSAILSSRWKKAFVGFLWASSRSVLLSALVLYLWTPVDDLTLESYGACH